MSTRRATHAGSWYTDSGRTLNSQLEEWLSNASGGHGPARAIIAPHAGYSYCGPCAAYAYKQVCPEKVKRVFILGPSHNVRSSECSLSPCLTYKTPLYDLIVDQKVYEELHATGQFGVMSKQTDENEHSLEMHLPYIAKVMEKFQGQFTIVPVLVGSLSVEREMDYGKIFSDYLADPGNLFVISSDFCHWGRRFRFTFYNQSCGEIYQSIENLDRMGMNIIEKMDPVEFASYLKKYQNTICGRHPIGVLLNAIDSLSRSGKNGHPMSLRFLKYAQSSKCTSFDDSSVSYAAACFKIG